MGRIAAVSRSSLIGFEEDMLAHPDAVTNTEPVTNSVADNDAEFNAVAESVSDANAIPDFVFDKNADFFRISFGCCV